MNRETLKKFICNGLAEATALEEFPNCNVIFITSIGMIIGNLTDSELPEENLISKMAQTLADIYSENYELDSNPISGNDGYIVLNNVVIKNSNATYNMKQIVLFYDQIIGISLGNLE